LKLFSIRIISTYVITIPQRHRPTDGRKDRRTDFFLP